MDAPVETKSRLESTQSDLLATEISMGSLYKQISVPIQDMEIVVGMTSVSIGNTSNTFSQQQENSNLTTTTNKNDKPSKNSLLESETSVIEKYNGTGPNPFIKTVKYPCYRKSKMILF